MESSKTVSRTALVVVFSCFVFLCGAHARGAIIFHTSGEANFLTAMSDLTHVGTEDFEGSTLIPAYAEKLNDPLAQGSPVRRAVCSRPV